MHWRRKWQPTPVFLPGESQGRGTWWAEVYGVTQSRTQLKRLSSSSIVYSSVPSNSLRPQCNVAHQAPLSTGFSRQEHWSGMPFPSAGDPPHPGIEPKSPALQEDSLPAEPPGKPTYAYIYIYTPPYKIESLKRKKNTLNLKQYYSPLKSETELSPVPEMSVLG